MRWNRYPTSEYPGNLWQDWDTLNTQYCQSHPLLDSRFVQPLIEYFPATIDVLACFEHDECIALALLENRKGLIQRPYLPSQAQVALLLIPDGSDCLKSFGKSGLQSLTVRMDFLSVDSKFQGHLPLLKKFEATYKGTDMIIDIDGDFSQYWAKRPKNLRKNIVRYSNRISKDFDQIELKLITDEQEVDLAVARYGFIESQGWKGKSRTALHPGNTQGNFYREILTKFSRSGEAHIFELWVDKELVASRLCIGNGKLLIILKTTFREEYKMYAFGRILLYKMLEHVFEGSLVNTVGFYTNATKEQLDWSTGSRPTYNISLYRGALGSFFRNTLKAKSMLMDLLHIGS